MQNTGQGTKSLVSAHPHVCPSVEKIVNTVLDQASNLEQSFSLTFWRKDFAVVQLEVVYTHAQQWIDCALYFTMQHRNNSSY